jgi:hypothetical protein
MARQKAMGFNNKKMNNLIGTIALLSLAIPGFFINCLILGKKRPIESLALSWLTGSVVFTLIIYILNFYLGIKLNLLVSCLAYWGLTIVSFFLALKNVSLPKLDFNKYRVLKISVLAFFVLTFATSLFFPVMDWDAVTVFDFRAKILLVEGFIHQTPFQMMYAGYPMYTSLLHFWAYITGLWTAMPIYPLFTISLFAGVFFAAKRLFSDKVAFLIAAACIFAPRIFANSFIAYTNLPYSVLLILGDIYIYLWTESKNWQDLIIGVILSTATFWVRSFPFAIVNFSLIFLAIPFIKKYSRLLSVITLLLLMGCYIIPIFHPVADYLKWSVFEYYSPYWIIFVGIFIYDLITKSKDWFWTLLFLGYCLLLFAGTYIFNTRFPGYYQAIPDALRRMTIFICPIVILFAAKNLKK